MTRPRLFVKLAGELGEGVRRVDRSSLGLALRRLSAFRLSSQLAQGADVALGRRALQLPNAGALRLLR